MTEGIIILNENSNEQVMFWLVGSLSSMKWDEILTILPWLIGALIATIFIGRQLTIMELGDDIAKGLGQNINKVRIIIGLLVIILTGMSVSIAGPIGFVGLIVPHIVKRYVSKNYLVMIPLTFIIGADLLLLSDVLSRLITYPYESPVGIVTSFVGALYFLFITIKGEKNMMTTKIIRRYSLITILLIVSIFISLCVGSVMIHPIDAIKGIFTQDDFILNEYRIPRTLLGIIIGSSLAISGAIIQAVIRNPLASPDVIGISKGASLAAVIIIMIFPTAPLFVLPIGSFLGAFAVSLFLSF